MEEVWEISLARVLCPAVEKTSDEAAETKGCQSDDGEVTWKKI